MRSLSNTTTTVDRDRLLAVLRENKEQHIAMHAEAREGYIQKAMKALELRMLELRDAHVVSLDFKFRPPQNYEAEYDTAIQMMEWNENDQVTLTAEEFRCFVLDDWDWTSNFLYSNSPYSSSTRRYAMSKGVDV